MKVFYVLFISSLILVVSSCDNQNQITNPDNYNQSILEKKGGNKPPKVQEPVINLSIDGIPIITGNIADTENQLFSLGESKLLHIELNVNSPGNNLSWVGMELYYDSNVDNVINTNDEFGGFILDVEPNEESYNYIFDWNGILLPLAFNDPTYTDKFLITDQLATPPEIRADDADHYYIRIFAGGTESGTMVGNFIWLNNSIQPAGIFHVEDICYRGAVRRGGKSYIGEWQVKIVDDNNAAVENAEVYMYYNDNTTANIGRALCLPTNEAGWATISNSFDRKSFGELKMTVRGVQKFNYDVGDKNRMIVYNPLNNTDGWEPFSSVIFPTQGPDDCGHTH
ncbi:hypothetical protein ACFLS9_01220 [Bacteroidota bacterium]